MQVEILFSENVNNQHNIEKAKHLHSEIGSFE